jgi:catechol 2,3-dioxygenase-like lactoylglutathione lyase family enzyme
MRPRSSFAGAAIEVSDLARSVAFHRVWLPMLGFHRVWASPDRVMWSRGYDHFVMRQAKDGISYGPGALWLAVSAESRGQVDQVFAELRDAGAEIIQPPQELDYLAPGYYSVGFRDPDGVPIEVMHRWDDLPEVRDAEQVRVPGHGVSLGGYFFKPVAGQPPLSGADPAARICRPRPQHGRPRARRRGQRLCRPSLSPCAAGWVRKARTTRACASPSTSWPPSTGWPSGRWSTATESPWSARRWADRWRCWPPPTSRRYAPSPPSLRPRTWRAGARPIPTCATISTISAAPRACRCARRSCGSRRSTRPSSFCTAMATRTYRSSSPLAMAESLRNHGKDAEAVVIPGATHYFTEQQNAAARRTLFDFLRRHLIRS